MPFQCYAFLHMPVWSRRQKGLRALNFALLLVVFKWHRGSEGVNVISLRSLLGTPEHFIALNENVYLAQVWLCPVSMFRSDHRIRPKQYTFTVYLASVCQLFHWKAAYFNNTIHVYIKAKYITFSFNYTIENMRKLRLCRSHFILITQYKICVN